jgi:DNA repair protein RadA/Sms
MAKSQLRFVCQACGSAFSKWSGRCDNCGEWNSLVEEAAAAPLPGAKGAGMPKGKAGRLVPLKGDEPPLQRIESGLAELDRVTGGGLVPGSAVLIGGDPGIGKSTLLIQALAALARAGHATVYISGEEAIAQIRLRAERLGLVDAPVLLAAETNLSDVLATLSDGRPPAVTVIDSIQTLWSPAVESAPGTVSQLRAGTEALIRFAKQKASAVLLVGHVTKDGQIAGPRVIEHMVDTVLYFEGDRGHQFRILRAVKNRFGPTDEIGVFEMSDRGLREVQNPSRLFISARETEAPGSAILAGMEGTRPVLTEVQALVSPSPLGTPRRAVVGFDSNRLAMILAVLEARAGLRIGAHDVYLNVAGGLKVREPAADLAAAAALVSSLHGAPLPGEAVLFGEIALSGAVRPVGQSEQRLKEAAKLGLTSAVIAGNGGEPAAPRHLRLRRVETVSDLVAWVAALPRQERTGVKPLLRPVTEG